MATSKRTIARDSVFRGTGTGSERPLQGVVAQEKPTRQTAVWLADEEVDWLDTQCQVVKRAGWRNITRSALIRSLIRAAMEQEHDLGGVSGEQELAQRLLARR
jgi:hypothetical protein